MKILFIGDIVGRPGREAVAAAVPDLIKKENLDFVIANGENMAGGSGITIKTADFLFNAGVDVITSGDHIWKRKEIYLKMEEDNRILKPANFPEETPGRGFGIYKTKTGIRIGVINLQGRVFMKDIDSPFIAAVSCIEKIKKETSVIIVDIHAEATSEKTAMGYFLDGKVSAVLGTHTHVQTADERILPKGTSYITDAGMTGSYDSVLGRQIEPVIKRFLTNMPLVFPVSDKDVRIQGVIIEIDDKEAISKSIKRINLKTG